MNITGEVFLRARTDTVFADVNQNTIFNSGYADNVSGSKLTNLIQSGATWLKFDASKGWTGETSAVGGGGSHTHGIKMTVRGVQSVVYRLNCLFYV